jgi:hypothetical protein
MDGGDDAGDIVVSFLSEACTSPRLSKVHILPPGLAGHILHGLNNRKEYNHNIYRFESHFIN